MNYQLWFNRNIFSVKPLWEIPDYFYRIHWKICSYGAPCPISWLVIQVINDTHSSTAYRKSRRNLSKTIKITFSGNCGDFSCVIKKNRFLNRFCLVVSRKNSKRDFAISMKFTCCIKLYIRFGGKKFKNSENSYITFLLNWQSFHKSSFCYLSTLFLILFISL